MIRDHFDLVLSSADSADLKPETIIRMMKKKFGLISEEETPVTTEPPKNTEEKTSVETEHQEPTPDHNNTPESIPASTPQENLPADHTKEHKENTEVKEISKFDQEKEFVPG